MDEMRKAPKEIEEIFHTASVTVVYDYIVGDEGTIQVYADSVYVDEKKEDEKGIYYTFAVAGEYRPKNEDLSYDGNCPASGFGWCPGFRRTSLTRRSNCSTI